MDVAVLWEVGDVLGGEAEVEVADQGDGFRDEVVAVSLERSVEQGGCAAGSRGHSKGPLRVRVGE